MFFCGFCENFKTTFCTESLWVNSSGSSGRDLKTYQNDIDWGNNSDFNANTEHIFAAIILEATIQSNLTKSSRFSREVSVVGFCYSETIWDSQQFYLWLKQSFASVLQSRCS